ncbi:hypothetical protein NESM_000590100 [Novymonas esmeraldas]|uniref:C3H1-type domain-containing protein n=1 Tax=Novymonas esmeraldas TaxID=1808958 RepID=A0AAW0ES32_9TRYP
MSYAQSFGTQSSAPMLRVGSTANSMHTGSYNNHPNTTSSLGSGTLLRPRQSARVPPSPGGPGQRAGSRMAGVTTIYAIDTASTKLAIPITAVEPTLAFEDDGLVPGLCRLYMEGRCRQSQRCFQVHADPGVVDQLRREALSAPSCCPAHGAKCNLSGFPLGLSIVLDPPREKEPAAAAEANIERETGSTEGSSSNGESNTAATGAGSGAGTGTGSGAGGCGSGGHSANCTDNKAVVMLHNVCPTRYLRSRYEEKGGMVLHVPKAKICREHRKGLCRFGNECCFLHLCRQIPLISAEDELMPSHGHSHSHSRTLSRQAPTVHGSMHEFSSQPPSFAAAANGSLYQHTRSQSHSCSQANMHHFHTSMLVPQSSSFADGSFGTSQANSRPPFSRGMPPAAGSLGDHQPLLRPLGSVQQNSHGSMPTRGSFCHNPYGEASSFQN